MNNILRPVTVSRESISTETETAGEKTLEVYLSTGAVVRQLSQKQETRVDRAALNSTLSFQFRWSPNTITIIAGDIVTLDNENYTVNSVDKHTHWNKNVVVVGELQK